MAGIHPHIGARAELIAEIRTREDAAKRGKFRSAGLNRDDSSLVVAFIAREEEDPILANRPAGLITELVSLEQGIRIGGVAPQPGVRGQIVVPIKVEPTAVIVVAAGTSDDVD